MLQYHNHNPKKHKKQRVQPQKLTHNHSEKVRQLKKTKQKIAGHEQ